MNKKQQEALATLAVGVVAVVAIDKLNTRNAAILGIPPIAMTILIALIARGLNH